MFVCIVQSKAAFSTSTATSYKNDLFQSIPPSKQSPPPLETVLQYDEAVIPGEPNDCGRDPESRKVAEIQIILDPPPSSAGDDELGHSLQGGSQRAGSRKTPNRFLIRSGDVPIRLREIT